MTLHHPFQQLSPETFDWLMRWSRIAFWIILALFAYVARSSMPRSITPEKVIRLAATDAGALGFWVGFDYLFMPAYTLFFSVCCVWGAGLFAPGTLWYTLGIALAWGQVPQLVLDMAENYCMWQIARGKNSPGIEKNYRRLAKAKIPLFAGAAGYALLVSILFWFKVIPG